MCFSWTSITYSERVENVMTLTSGENFYQGYDYGHFGKVYWRKPNSK